MLEPADQELLDRLRPEFLLRPDVTFLNHGSYGACPRAVFENYQAWQLELERQPVDFIGRRFVPLMAEAREKLGRYLNAAADELVYVPNATIGLNVVARSLPLGPGDEVLGTDQEYGALDRTWRFVCQRRGARYVAQRLPLPVSQPEEIIDAVWSGVTERTKVLFISHITSPTALILPIAELVRWARERGIITVIDGAHAPGQIPLDLTSLGADFYSGNCHKWMMAPKGSGFLYARREQQQLIKPLVVSWGWEAEVPSTSQFIDEQEYTGTRDFAAYLATPAAIDFMQRHDWPRVQQACHELTRIARERLVQITGQPALSPDDGSWFRQLVAVPLPPCNIEVLRERMYPDYHVEVPFPQAAGKFYVRASLQAYNRIDDIDRLCAALAELLDKAAIK